MKTEHSVIKQKWFSMIYASIIPDILCVNNSRKIAFRACLKAAVKCSVITWLVLH